MTKRLLVFVLAMALANVAGAQVVWDYTGGAMLAPEEWHEAANWSPPLGSLYTYPTEQYADGLGGAGVEFVNKDITAINIVGYTVDKNTGMGNNDLYLGGTDCKLTLNSGASLTIGDDMKIGRTDDGASPASTIDILGASTLHVNDDFYMGDNETSDCVMNVAGGSTFSVDAAFIADGGEAEINVSGGSSVEARNYWRIGNNSTGGVKGTVTVDGSGCTFTSGYSTHVGNEADTTGELTITNGAEANVGTRLRIGGASSSTTAGSTGTVTVSNGSTLRVGVKVDNTEEDLRVGYGLGSTGTLKVLSGSRVEAGTARTCNYGATGFWEVDGNSTVEVVGNIQLSQQADSVSTVTVTNGSSFSSTGARVYVGISGTTNMTVTDSTIGSGTDFRVGYAATSVATLDISGTSVLNCGRDFETFIGSGTIDTAGEGVATIHVYNGDVNINGYCSLGHSIEGGSQTTFILDAGTVDVGLAPPEGAPDDLVLGWEDSDANVDLTLNGGVMTVAGAIYFGRSDDGYGTPITRTGANTGQLRINIAGGTLQAEDYIVTSILIPGTYVPGDADNNGQVDEIDAQVLATNWGSSGTEIDWEDGDFDDDDMVGPRDAAIMAANWYAANSTESDHLITLSAGYLRINGSAMSEAEMEALIGTDIVCPNGYSIYTDGAYTVLTSGATEAGAVPEPSTLMLLASAVFGLLLWRRK